MTGFFEVVGHLFEAIFTIAMIVLPVVVLYLIIRRAVSGGLRDANESGVAQHPRTPRDILDERYAHGEIGRDEYEQVRRDLETGYVDVLSKGASLW